MATLLQRLQEFLQPGSNPQFPDDWEDLKGGVYRISLTHDENTYAISYMPNGVKGYDREPSFAVQKKRSKGYIVLGKSGNKDGVEIEVDTKAKCNALLEVDESNFAVMLNAITKRPAPAIPAVKDDPPPAYVEPKPNEHKDYKNFLKYFKNLAALGITNVGLDFDQTITAKHLHAGGRKEEFLGGNNFASLEAAQLFRARAGAKGIGTDKASADPTTEGAQDLDLSKRLTPQQKKNIRAKNLLPDNGMALKALLAAAQASGINIHINSNGNIEIISDVLEAFDINSEQIPYIAGRKDGNLIVAKRDGYSLAADEISNTGRYPHDHKVTANAIVMRLQGGVGKALTIDDQDNGLAGATKDISDNPFDDEFHFHIPDGAIGTGSFSTALQKQVQASARAVEAKRTEVHSAAADPKTSILGTSPPVTNTGDGRPRVMNPSFVLPRTPDDGKPFDAGLGVKLAVASFRKPKDDRPTTQLYDVLKGYLGNEDIDKINLDQVAPVVGGAAAYNYKKICDVSFGDEPAEIRFARASSGAYSFRVDFGKIGFVKIDEAEISTNYKRVTGTHSIDINALTIAESEIEKVRRAIEIETNIVDVEATKEEAASYREYNSIFDKLEKGFESNNNEEIAKQYLLLKVYQLQGVLEDALGRVPNLVNDIKSKITALEGNTDVMTKVSTALDLIIPAEIEGGKFREAAALLGGVPTVIYKKGDESERDLSAKIATDKGIPEEIRSKLSNFVAAVKVRDEIAETRIAAQWKMSKERSRFLKIQAEKKAAASVGGLDVRLGSSHRPDADRGSLSDEDDRPLDSGLDGAVLSKAPPGSGNQLGGGDKGNRRVSSSDNRELNSGGASKGAIRPEATREEKEAAAQRIQRAYRRHLAKKAWKKSADGKMKPLGRGRSPSGGDETRLSAPGPVPDPDGARLTDEQVAPYATTGTDQNKELIAHAYALMTIDRLYGKNHSDRKGYRYFLNEAIKISTGNENAEFPGYKRFQFDGKAIPTAEEIKAVFDRVQGRGVKYLAERGIVKDFDAQIAEIEKTKTGDAKSDANKDEFISALRAEEYKLENEKLSAVDALADIVAKPEQLLGIYPGGAVPTKTLTPFTTGDDGTEKKITPESESDNYYLEFSGMDIDNVNISTDDNIFMLNANNVDFKNSTVDEIPGARLHNCRSDRFNLKADYRSQQSWFDRQEEIRARFPQLAGTMDRISQLNAKSSLNDQEKGELKNLKESITFAKGERGAILSKVSELASSSIGPRVGLDSQQLIKYQKIQLDEIQIGYSIDKIGSETFSGPSQYQVDKGYGVFNDKSKQKYETLISGGDIEGFYESAATIMQDLSTQIKVISTGTFSEIHEQRGKLFELTEQKIALKNFVAQVGSDQGVDLNADYVEAYRKASAGKLTDADKAKWNDSKAADKVRRSSASKVVNPAASSESSLDSAALRSSLDFEDSTVISRPNLSKTDATGGDYLLSAPLLDQPKVDSRLLDGATDLAAQPQILSDSTLFDGAGTESVTGARIPFSSAQDGQGTSVPYGSSVDSLAEALSRLQSLVPSGRDLGKENMGSGNTYADFNVPGMVEGAQDVTLTEAAASKGQDSGTIGPPKKSPNVTATRPLDSKVETIGADLR